MRCVRADFPYRRAGRKAPDRAPVLMASIRETLAELPADEPLVMGGRSMGGRMCSMVAAGVDGLPPPANLRGLVLISYPLHPPGQPAKLRVDHLPAIRVPTLFISGTNDAFGKPDEITQLDGDDVAQGQGRPRLAGGQGPRPEALRRHDRGRGQGLPGAGGIATGTASTGLSASSSWWAVSGNEVSTTVTTTTWPRATTPITLP